MSVLTVVVVKEGVLAGAEQHKNGKRVLNIDSLFFKAAYSIIIVRWVIAIIGFQNIHSSAFLRNFWDIPSFSC